MRFSNRQSAGEALAQKLQQYRKSDVVVYALPRGGLPLAVPIVRELKAPLDLLITRKISHPSNPEYAVCAVSEQGVLLCNETERASLDPLWLHKAVKQEQKEAFRRKEVYLHGKKHISAKGKTAIIVDDGVATGLTLRVAIQVICTEQPKEIVVAVPVAPHSMVEVLRKEVDVVVVLKDETDYLGAVGSYYDLFPQVTDEEVLEYLQEAADIIQ